MFEIPSPHHYSLLTTSEQEPGWCILVAYSGNPFCAICGNMAKDDEYFRLRIPEDLRAMVLQAAADNNRSMTSEIIFRVRASFAAESERDAKISLLSENVDRMLEIMQRELGQGSGRKD
jgi:hypothetical protein